MAKVVAGFCLGVLVTSLAFVWINGRSTDRLSDSAVSFPSATNEAPIQSATSAVATSVQSAGASTRSRSPDERVPGAEMSGGPQMIEPVMTTSSAVSSRSNQLTESPDPQYPPEIDFMIENRVNKELHERYLSDEREESWATYMEGQLSAYFGQKPELAQFNFSLLECRTSICEIHALGYGPDALTQWNLATADLVTQPWHDFKRMSMDRYNAQPDVLGIVLILSRKQQ